MGGGAMSASAAETLFAFQLRVLGIDFEREYRFAPGRKWRADFRIADVLIEVEGGTWTNGRHTRGLGFELDCLKYGEAAALGFRLVRVTPAMIDDGRAIQLVRRVLAGGARADEHADAAKETDFRKET